MPSRVAWAGVWVFALWLASTGSAAAQDDAGATCERTEVEAEPLPTNVLIVLDRSRSMYQEDASGMLIDRWTPAVDAIVAVTASLEGSIRFGLELFSGEGTCGAGEVVVPVGAGTASDVESALAGDPSEVTGGGTPTATSMQVAQDALAGASGERFVLLVTDGAPNCNMDLDVSSCECVRPDGMCMDSRNCLDDDRTVTAIEELAAAGTSTYVIGYDTSEWRDVLDRMAAAGDTERTSHIPVTDRETLEGALRDVVGSTVPCAYDLGFAPESASLVRVEVDGSGVDPASDAGADSGWILSDGTKVELVGDSCTALQDGEKHEVVIETCAPDSDGDGVSDPQERTHCTDPEDGECAYGVSVDGQCCADPNDPDSDGDGYSDGEEIERGSDPLDPQSYPRQLRGGGGPAGGCRVGPAHAGGLGAGALVLLAALLSSMARRRRR